MICLQSRTQALLKLLCLRSAQIEISLLNENIMPTPQNILMKTITKTGTVKFNSTYLICLLLFLGLIATACKKESVFLKRPKPELIIKSDNPRLKSKTIHFVKDTVYVLQVSMVIDSGQILKIDAGSLIKVNINHSIIVKPGGKIEAEGSRQEPIVFTVKTDKGGGGTRTANGYTSWKGIWMYGSAVSLNSGKLRYVRIEFAGTQNSTAEDASLYLINVGNQTSLDHIQVSYSNHPAFEFNGGSVNASNLVAYATYKSDFVLNNGYRGKLQHLVALRHPYTFFGNENGGLLLKDSETFPIISNVTVIGPDNQKGFTFTSGGNPNAGIIAKLGARFHIRNSAVLGFPIGGLQIDGSATAIALRDGVSSIMHSVFHSNQSDRAFYINPSSNTGFTSAQLEAFLAVKDNIKYTQSSKFLLKAPFDFYSTNSPDPSPSSDSPLLNGARFEDVFDDPFFKKVNYRGALGAGADNWLQGWTNFVPLQTNYNF